MSSLSLSRVCGSCSVRSLEFDAETYIKTLVAWSSCRSIHCESIEVTADVLTFLDQTGVARLRTKMYMAFDVAVFLIQASVNILAIWIETATLELNKAYWNNRPSSKGNTIARIEYDVDDTSI
ncbi:hypothetical protein TgHK011_002059 [Trichoderma gracile]|nr:hypothetical protein TgHK011_002059 [Trichoderma gracile]